MKFSRIALLSAATLAVAQPHNHAHHHRERRGSPVEGRDAVATVTLPGAVQTVYELNGHPISWADVEAGIRSGKYVLVNGQVSSVAQAPVATSAPSTPASTPSASAPSSSVQAAQYIEKAKSSSAAPSSTYVAPASSSTQAAPSSGSSSSSSTGNWPDFTSGSEDCTTFPSEYGAIDVDWMNVGGWSGIQHVPNFSGTLGSAGGLISYIEPGSGCAPNTFCSYACPAGYQKSQWPEQNQGSIGQSIGGLYCNSQGKLELTRSDVNQLCTKGAGGVTIESTVGNVISVCRTDYPGTESETVPLAIHNGDKNIELTNPDTANYYTWEGSTTSAQYYLNPSGNQPNNACCWNTPGSYLGNYSPVNLGTSATNGLTSISIFGNYPTITDFTGKNTLDYNVNFIADGTPSNCKYENQQFYDNNGQVTDYHGCTVSFLVSVQYPHSLTKNSRLPERA
jgi:SUN family beta-glucosidase